MWCGIVTLFPDMFTALNYGIPGRAIKKGLLVLEKWDPRDYTDDKHRTVDDRPYGGGPGMVMMAPPLKKALQKARQKEPSAKVISVSPAGRRFGYRLARQLATENRPLIFIAGRYEGIDQRLIDSEVEEQLSLGDYVLSGGELAVMVIIDAITRWLPGVLGHPESALNDAFSEENNGLLDCPHYTRPLTFEGKSVPSVLLSGNHAQIARWRKKQALGQTWLYRPDLLAVLKLDEQSQTLLAEFQQECINNF